MAQHILLHQSRTPECACAAPGRCLASQNPAPHWPAVDVVVRSSQAWGESWFWEQPQCLEPSKRWGTEVGVCAAPAVLAKSSCPQHFLRGFALWLFTAVEAAVWIWKLQFTPRRTTGEDLDEERRTGIFPACKQLREHSSRDAWCLVCTTAPCAPQSGPAALTLTSEAPERWVCMAIYRTGSSGIQKLQLW